MMFLGSPDYFWRYFVNYNDLSGNNRGSIYFRLRVYMSRAPLCEGQSVNINSKYLSLRFIFRHENFLSHVEDTVHAMLFKPETK